MIGETDRALVHSLQVAPRAKWSALARVLDMGAESLETRWKRLSAWRIAWLAPVLNRGFTNQGCVAYVGALCQPALIEQVTEKLASTPEVLSVEVTTGTYDLILTIASSDLGSMTTCLLDRIDKTDGLTRSHAMLATTLFKDGSQWQLQSLSKQQITDLKTMVPRTGPRESAMSAVDYKLWNALVRDARMSFTDLGAAAEVSRNTAQRRVDNMLRTNRFAIRCDVSAPAFGWPIIVSFGIDVEPGELEAVGKGIASMRPVRLVAAIADRPNLWVTSWLRSLDDVLRFETMLMKQFGCIRIVNRAVNLRSRKRMGTLLDCDGLVDKNQTSSIDSELISDERSS